MSDPQNQHGVSTTASSGASPGPGPDNGSPTDGGAADPLAKLHKMSRTAGLGSQEYVAINGPSVAALLFGLGSGLVVLFGWTLLVIPITAIVLASVALRQIRNSNGTQTGSGAAWLGLLLALAFSGWYGGNQWLHWSQTREDRQKIVQLIEAFGQDLAAKNYDAAYQKFSDRFRERVSRAQFDDLWSRMIASPIYGNVKTMRWNGRLMFQDDPTSGNALADGLVILDVEKSEEPDRQHMRFRKVQGQWLIDDIPAFFPPPQPQQGAPGQGPPG